MIEALTRTLWGVRRAAADGVPADKRLAAAKEMTVTATDTNGRRFATVDTGGPDDVFPGRLMTWIHRPRGGYGYEMAIPVTVVEHASRPQTWVAVEIARRDGSLSVRRVDVSSLRERR